MRVSLIKQRVHTGGHVRSLHKPPRASPFRRKCNLYIKNVCHVIQIGYPKKSHVHRGKQNHGETKAIYFPRLRPKGQVNELRNKMFDQLSPNSVPGESSVSVNVPKLLSSRIEELINKSAIAAGSHLRTMSM